MEEVRKKRRKEEVGRREREEGENGRSKERRRFVWLIGFLTSSSATRLYRGRVPRLTSDNFKCSHTRDRAWGKSVQDI